MRTVFEVLKECTDKIIYLKDQDEYKKIKNDGLLNPTMSDGTRVQFKLLSVEAFDNLSGAEQFDLSDQILTR